MDEAVEEEEDPDRRAHVLDPDKETPTGSHMMVSLQGRALLSLQEDDGGIDKLVELGDVEPPAVKGEPLVPKSTELIGFREIGVDGGLGGTGGKRVRLEPRLGRRGRVVDRSVAQSRSPLHPAEGVHRSPKPVWRGERVLETPPRSSDDPYKRPSRVDGEKDVVGDHEPEETGRLADRPGLPTALAINVVPGLDDEDVGRGQEERPFVVQRSEEEVFGDGKGSSAKDGGLVDGRDRQGRRIVVGEVPDRKVGDEGEFDRDHIETISTR